jgi:SAM-dependent methyltransferase
MLPILFLILNLAFAMLIFYLTIAFITGAPFVPSTGLVSQKMIEFAGIKPGMKVVDLGSGDGRLLFMAAQKGAYAVGYEINPFLVLYTNLRIFFSPYRSQIRVCWKNFWQADIRGTDAIFIYLLPWRMEELHQKLKFSLKPGARVISNSFIFPKWEVWKKEPGLHVYAFKVS